ncbi:TonB family protein [Deltaproteobacteria bacterium OttesenSCG-928-M10]|nr:TonB family protein [Deltaproteobacteria bacterium OttesenSCG-928-M10]
MSHIISPYDRENGRLEKILSLAVFGSIAVHVLICWAFLFLLPSLHSERQSRNDEIIMVQLLGSLVPPAPAAPANLPVNPDSKLPDIIEAPKGDPQPTPQPQFTPSPPDPVAAPTDVIPLGPKAPEKPPEIKKTQAPPPKPQAPKVEPEKPKKPPVNKNLDADIEKRMQQLERKVEADTLDDDIEARMMNLAKAQGAGHGEGSQSGGATQGQRIHPEKMRYYEHIKDIVSMNWIPPAGAISGNIKTVFQIRIEPNGHVSASKVLQSSGNVEYDQSVERAVKKSSPFPPLPAIFEGVADEPALVFDSEKLRGSAAP